MHGIRKQPSPLHGKEEEWARCAAVMQETFRERFKCPKIEGKGFPCTAREREGGKGAARMWTMQGMCNLCPRMLKRPSKLLEHRDNQDQERSNQNKKPWLNFPTSSRNLSWSRNPCSSRNPHVIRNPSSIRNPSLIKNPFFFKSSISFIPFAPSM